MQHTKIILATAYAVNPYKGSEDGMGWHFIRQIARNQRVVAITRENNRPHIEQYMRENPDPRYTNMQFFYFDLPYWMRFWKKGSNLSMIYYYFWQKGIPAFIQKQNIQFDIAHNLNFHNDWTPSFLWKLGKPFVWGPIGHHDRIPEGFSTANPWSEKAKWWIKQYFWKRSAALKNTVRNAQFILAMNPAVPGNLGLRKGSYEIMPSVATEDFGHQALRPQNTFRIISAGRLVPLKGFDLTIRAFAHFIRRLPLSERQKTELIIVGSGPEQERLNALVRALEMEPYIRFIHWMQRSELLALYQDASVFLFPSHEGAGMVVAEALSFGLPVICLENNGPGAFIHPGCGFAVPAEHYEKTVEDLAAPLLRLYFDRSQLQAMRIAARYHFEQYFHWDRRGEQLQKIYQQLSPQKQAAALQVSLHQYEHF